MTDFISDRHYAFHALFILFYHLQHITSLITHFLNAPVPLNIPNTPLFTSLFLPLFPPPPTTAQKGKDYSLFTFMSLLPKIASHILGV